MPIRSRVLIRLPMSVALTALGGTAVAADEPPVRYRAVVMPQFGGAVYNQEFGQWTVSGGVPRDVLADGTVVSVVGAGAFGNPDDGVEDSGILWHPSGETLNATVTFDEFVSEFTGASETGRWIAGNFAAEVLASRPVVLDRQSNELIELPRPDWIAPTDYAIATDVSDAVISVGYTSDPSGYLREAIAWSGEGVLNRLGFLTEDVGPYAPVSQATAVAADGTIFGASLNGRFFDDGSPAPLALTSGFAWTPQGGMVEILPPGFRQAYITHADDSGAWVSGAGNLEGFADIGPTIGFVYNRHTGELITAEEALPGGWTRLMDTFAQVNASRQIVGRGVEFSGRDRFSYAARLRDGAIENLNEWIVGGLPAGVTVDMASGINDDGWIACYGAFEVEEASAPDGSPPPDGVYISRGVLLVPLPPAEYTGDDRVNVQDLLAYLAAMRGQERIADFDGDGNVTVEDLLGYLTAFRAG